MTETGHGVQVVTVEDDHSYKLNELELRNILLDDRIKDLPVAVVSVAGAYRGGKSFLLNFFIRYLSSTLQARQDGSWLGSENDVLTGFSWRGGSERNTTGILIWSEPFLVRKPSGEKVAVLLMDTQGTFDSTSSVKDCSTIFALSTLISSTQIYNLRDNIKEDDLQNLQLFTNFGKLMKTETGKAFQLMEFLIRDWGNDWEYDYGEKGGALYLDKILGVTEKTPPELKELHQNIVASFEKVACFLMPHPGLKVSKKTFSGKLKDIEEEFLEGLKELSSSIFSPQKVNMKLMGGHPVTSRELFSYFKSYMTIFNSNTIPTPKTIFETTTEAGLLLAYNEAREQYETNMQLACGTEAPSMPAIDVLDFQKTEVAAARATFNSKKLMGSRKVIDDRLELLVHDLDSRQNEFMEINASKTMKAKNRGNTAYEKAIDKVTQGKSLCVHASDLKAVHDAAVEDAIKAFEENRRKVPGRKDDDRDKFVSELASKYAVLRLTNQQNNNAAVVELKNDYFQGMVVLCNHDPKLSPEQFEEEHSKALKRALDEFELRRNRPNGYNSDTFKYNLQQSISLLFSQLKQINSSKNTEAFQLALLVYSEGVFSLSELRKHCIHPDDLKKNHEDAMCQALIAFDKDRSCEEGFDDTKKDQKLLHSICMNRYEPMADINNTANEAAVESAYERFRNKFDSLKPWYYFLQSWDTAKEYHDQALNEALEVFYSKRRDRKYHAKDSYIEDLKRKCLSYYRP